jgi:hypothetical protein
VTSSPLATSLSELPTSSISVAPYLFSLNPDTHQLHTTWEVKGSSISLICAFAEVSLMELGWTGESKELSSGNSWAVNCEEEELGDKMVIEVDVTKFRVQPFKSYKVCISLEDSPTDSHLDEVCTHLFSFEKYVPYVPDDDEMEVKDTNKIHIEGDVKDIEDTKNVLKVSDEAENNVRILESEMKDIESVLKHQLDDIDNYVRDDFKSQFLELKNEIVQEIDQKISYSSASKSHYNVAFIILFIFSIVLNN